MEEFIAIFILISFFLAIVCVAWGIYGMIEFYYSRKENKLKKLYPEYYRKIKERDRLFNTDDTYQRKEAVKKIIDSRLIEIVYTPEEELPAKRMEIEQLKKEYQKVCAERTAKAKEIKQVQDEIDRIYNSTPQLQKFYKV